MANEDKDLLGRTMLVTGANAGIGRATAEALCARGARVHLACRSEERALPVVHALQARYGADAAAFLQLDLADLDSVRAAAQRFIDGGEPLHALINNAGLAGARGVTRQGFELVVGTNHVGPFLFTELLLERLKASAPARIVFVSSRSHLMARRIDFEKLHGPTRSFSSIPEYAVSKLANILCATELARRLEGSGVTTYALHPGVVKSDIWRRIPQVLHPLWFFVRGMVGNEEGARTSVWCATAPELADHSGRYYAREREVSSSRVAKDAALARALFDWTQKEVGL